MNILKRKIVSMLRKGTADYAPAGTKLYESEVDSREGLIVPELIFRFGDARAHARKFPKIMPWLLPAVYNRLKGYKTLNRNPAPPKTSASEELLSEIGAFAESLGCHAVGYTTVPGSYIFRDKSVLYPSAIVLAMPMDKSRIGRAPEISAGKEVWRAYDRLGRAVNKIAGFLRKRGFAAQAGAALGGDTNYVRLAMDAGLGWIGHHGVLISPGTGPSQRLAVVYTSIGNLPEPRENPHSWIADFCTGCLKCVRRCPGQAIYAEKPILEDGHPKYINHEKCAVPFANTMGCSVCLKECVFFSGDYEKIKAGYLKKIQTGNR